MAMTRRPPAHRQRGAALIIALIMIVLVSLVVVSAFNLSSSNLKTVTNIQYRSEAVTVANSMIETVVSSSFLTALNSTTSPPVDLNGDGTVEYSGTNVKVDIPQCPLRVRRVEIQKPTGFEVDSTSAISGVYTADYDLKATVSDAVTGASVVVHQGVRIPLTETEYQSYVASTCGLTLITS